MSAARLELRDFDGLRKAIRELAGIHLGDTKQQLVEGRLAPRLRALGLDSYGAYLRAVASDATGEEARELVNCITTNKTSFFREPHHFDFLKNHLVPEVVERARAGGQKRIRIWSAGCSTGQEPWSIAMTLAAALGSLAGWDIKILASDLDTEVLGEAELATYDDVAIQNIPAPLRDRFLEDAPNGEQRVIAPLRALVTFRRLNLTAPAGWNIRTRFDAILCRNVAIYFDRETQVVVFENLAALLEPTGYLMTGHSENLHWLSRVVRPIGTTIHVLAPGSSNTPAATPPLHLSAPAPAPALAPARQPRASGVTQDSPTPSAVVAALAERPRLERAITVGGVHASMKGSIIKTTLGSCVAACLFNPEAKVGGMNHFLLPEDKGGGRGPTNFGVNAMETLINAMMKLGGDRSRFVAKVFGGAEQLGGSLSVGRANAEFVLSFLEEEGIPVVAQKLGGTSALAVIFDTRDGRALVKTLDRAVDQLKAEKKYLAKLAREHRTFEDDITFFGTP